MSTKCFRLLSHANDNNREVEPTDRVRACGALGVHIAEGVRGTSVFGPIIIAAALYHQGFNPRVTGLNPEATAFNLGRLCSGARESIPRSRRTRLLLGTFYYQLLSSPAEHREAMEIAEEAWEAAEAGCPDLLDSGDTAGLLQAARSYREHVEVLRGSPGRKVQLLAVMLPLRRAKPALIICSNDELPETLVRYQAMQGS